MKQSLNVESVNDYARYVGAEELHPLVSIIHYDELKHCRHSFNNYQVYGVFLLQESPYTITYGQGHYSHNSGSLLCVAPGQTGGFGPSLISVTVPEDAPPLLIMTRVDHPNVAASLVALFMEWKKAGANAELHMYGDGKGPYELMPETGETTTELWSQQLIQWLRAKRFIGLDR